MSRLLCQDLCFINVAHKFHTTYACMSYFLQVLSCQYDCCKKAIQMILFPTWPRQNLTTTTKFLKIGWYCLYMYACRPTCTIHGIVYPWALFQVMPSRNPNSIQLPFSFTGISQQLRVQQQREEVALHLPWEHNNQEEGEAGVYPYSKDQPRRCLIGPEGPLCQRLE